MKPLALLAIAAIAALSLPAVAEAKSTPRAGAVPRLAAVAERPKPKPKPKQTYIHYEIRTVIISSY